MNLRPLLRLGLSSCEEVTEKLRGLQHFHFLFGEALSYNYTPDWKRASQCFWMTGMTLRHGARRLSWLTTGRHRPHVHLQSISERVLSALACLLVERMVCRTAERGCNKESEAGRDFQTRRQLLKRQVARVFHSRHCCSAQS